MKFKFIPDSYMTIEGQRYRVYWSDETQQFESEPEQLVNDILAWIRKHAPEQA